MFNKTLKLLALKMDAQHAWPAQSVQLLVIFLNSTNTTWLFLLAKFKKPNLSMYTKISIYLFIG
jgi:hypothetical protein|tara:strand:+ start:114 stop:305 length:192 start_codon:yes stop_codon:yes gene_type:complete